jgi:hypothetical protein
VIDRERLRQTLLDEFGGNLTAAFESAIDYYIMAEKRIDELEAKTRVLQSGFSYGAARVGHLSKRVSHPLKLDLYKQLDVAPVELEGDSPNG